MDDGSEFAIGIVAGICLLVLLITNLALYFTAPTLPPRQLYFCYHQDSGAGMWCKFRTNDPVDVSFVQPRGIG